jgi:Ca-activated chloride channel family protein
LLTDGANNTGPDPLGAAQQAAERGVRVYTIGYGTSTGTAPQQGNNSFGRGRFNRGVDEAALKAIAGLTGGKYYAAASADELQKVFESLPTNLVTREQLVEISVGFAGLGALLVAVAVLLSQLWHPLP